MPILSIRCLAALLSLAFAAAALAEESAAVRGLEIARAADAADRGFGDSRAEIDMLLDDGAGGSASRALTVETREVDAPGLGDWSLFRFSFPPDIEGTALLNYAKALEPDDQWLFLPALKRVKRITTANKAGAFMGSEFAYEDLTADVVEKYAYRHLGHEACGEAGPDFDCDRIERRPRYDNSGYIRQIAWIDSTHRQYRRIDYYDRKDSLFKTLTLNDYRRHLDRFWRAHRLTMMNHRNGKISIMSVKDYRFANGYPEARFTPAALTRLR